MPIGYLVTTGAMAAVVLAAVCDTARVESRPFRLSYVFGVWLNWPLLTFLAACRLDGAGDRPERCRITRLLDRARVSPSLASAGLVVLRRGRREPARRSSEPWTRASEPTGVTTWMPSSPLVSAVDPPSLASCSAPISAVAAASSGSRTSATALRAGQTCSTSIAIALIVRAAQSSSTSTRSSAASVSERATCSIGSPPRTGSASAQTTVVPPTADFPIR